MEDAEAGAAAAAALQRKRLRNRAKREQRKWKKLTASSSGDGMPVLEEEIIPASNPTPLVAMAVGVVVEEAKKKFKKRKKNKMNLLVNPGAMVAGLKEAMGAPEHSLLVAATVYEVVTILQNKKAGAGDAVAQELIEHGLLLLLPSLLHHSCPEVAMGSTEILGMLALSSYEINCRLAEEEEVLSALADMLLRSEAEHLLVACHSIIDVAVTALGCAALQKIPGLPQQLLRLVSCFADVVTRKIKTGNRGTASEPHGGVAIQDSACASLDGVKQDSSQCEDDETREELAIESFLNLSRDEAVELFDLTLAAVNIIVHDFSHLDLLTMPDVLTSFQTLWKEILYLQSQFEGDVSVVPIETTTEFIWAPNRRNQLATLIVRLVMQQSVEMGINDTAARSLFGEDENHVYHFFQEHWESSPALMTANSSEHGLSSFFGVDIAGESPAELLKFLVDGMVGCPLVVADEVDPICLYKDMEGELGHLPICGQDIRLVKCEAGEEVHYCKESETTSVSSGDCIQAYNSGHTVVIRGLQFRFPRIAAISDGLAMELGQVTIGANLYLTPPKSQGLGPHFDDHCVFVCQLEGHKSWNLYFPTEPLPRLYTFKTLAKDIRKECATQYALKNGDVLYIPRGFPHEAHTEYLNKVMSEPTQVSGAKMGNRCSKCRQVTTSSEQTFFAAESDIVAQSESSISKWAGASFHISFGVEVEPAFEWEGLLHIALCSWAHQSLQLSIPVSASQCKVEEFCTGLLHVAIRNIGNKSAVFRKACILNGLAGKQSLTPANEEGIFHGMLKEVNESADFHNAVQGYQEGVAWLSWLQNLSLGFVEPNCSIDEFSVVVLEDVFTEMKCRFVQEASFVESIKIQRSFLDRLRRSRQKVMNAFLALHSSYSNTV